MKLKNDAIVFKNKKNMKNTKKYEKMYVLK